MASDKSSAVMKSQRRKKIFAVEQFGRKCQRCGYDKCINALQFHHVDPSKKNYEPAYLIMRRSWDVAFKELQKCILVCANCHAEIHYQNLDVTEILLAAKIFNKYCKKCNSEFQTKDAQQIYCGVRCKSVSRRKVNKEPNKSDLKKLLDNKTPWTEIGKLYGVSDNAMRKWARKFDLI
jgi:hypothetical protein